MILCQVLPHQWCDLKVPPMSSSSWLLCPSLRRIQRGPEITGSINALGQDQDCQAQLKSEVETLDNSTKHSQISSVCKVDKQSYDPSLEFWLLCYFLMHVHQNTGIDKSFVAVSYIWSIQLQQCRSQG
ncbi:unnamed protein product [Sphagnum troendelagicum]|uniref:Uncharacterized protein n=1 Tax=Sphagnum troendelagicum TaxID=128251 RepID=A0ABP0TLP0_9BRYO